MRDPQPQSRSPLSILMAADVDPAEVIGGAERILREHSTRLAARGHQVTVLTRRESADRPEHEVVAGVDVYRYPVSSRSTLGFARSAILAEADLFRRISAERRFDVLNVHQPLAAAGLFRARESARTPRLYTYLSPWSEEYLVRAARNGAAHSPLARCARRVAVRVNAAARRRMEADAVRSCQRVMVLSEFSAGQVVGMHGVPRRRIAILPGAVDTTRFRPAGDRRAVKQRLGLPLDRPVLLTVRNLVPRMGLESLLEAVARVRQDVPELLLLIGGSGPLAEPLRAQARALGLWESDANTGAAGIPGSKTPSVRFAGFVPEGQLPDLYAAADLFVLPTACLEGFGLVTVEALACGTPVLGTPIGGTLEILRGLDPRHTLSGTSACDLAQGILAYLPRIGSADDRRRCRAYVEEHYSWDAVIPRIEELFHQTRDQGPQTRG